MVAVVRSVNVTEPDRGLGEMEVYSRLQNAFNRDVLRHFFESLKESRNLLHVYSEMFPYEYTNSTASTNIPGAFLPDLADAAGWNVDEFDEMGGVLYSQKEQEFLLLVYQRLFEYNLEWLLECALNNERLNVIPIDYLSIDINDRSIDDYTFGIQLLLLLSDMDDRSVLNANFTLDGDSKHLKKLQKNLGYYQELLWTAASSRSVDDDAFEAMCNDPTNPYVKVHPELKHAKFAIDIVHMNTGNFFFDENDSTAGFEKYQWRVGVLDDLSKDWKEALEMNEKFREIVRWLEESPDHFEEFVEMWNLCSGKGNEDRDDGDDGDEDEEDGEGDLETEEDVEAWLHEMHQLVRTEDGADIED
jgi:hypothetical protein